VRFLADGPSIPDELLVARDEGRVLFFCGAGVSRAKANLPGFLGLAERVLQELRALPSSPARKLVEIASKLQKEPIKGVGGILAADRIFGLLERDFALEDIERAVGQALKPDTGVSLDAHRIMLDLSRGPNGDVQLVTTNFDLLFESAAPALPIWTPSQLPDLGRNDHFNGIVHLHGMFDEAYQSPSGGNLVLSSAEFGRAYLAEGWATSFIRAAIAKYLIVFVGYTADDPPVQYLLEALHRVTGQAKALYAFQEGRDDEARVLWQQKGANAIAYSSDNRHTALWETLKAWAQRARAPERWRDRLIKSASRGPEAMKPHERGQVAHLAATAEGARALAESKTPLPATWLCVFDPAMRYATPGKIDLWKPDSPEVDPFVLFSVDMDTQPPRASETQLFKRREAPRDALDVLSPLPLDGYVGSVAGLRGDRSHAIAQLPQRLLSLAVWFMRVCRDPAAIWWAAEQKGLHPVLLRNIQFELEHRRDGFPPMAATAWRYLAEIWTALAESDFSNMYALRERIAKEGWTPNTRRDFALLLRPKLTAKRPYGAIPPAPSKKLPLHRVLNVSVEYPREHFTITVPDDQLAAILPLYRRILEEASELEREVSPYGLRDLPPIEPDPNLPGESSDRGFGINPLVLTYAALFKRSGALDRERALHEFSAWPQDDHPIFARLRVWAAGISDFLLADQAGAILADASNRVFWGSKDQRDVLLVIARRWKDLSALDRKKLEQRLRRGLPKERRDNRKLYPKWRAYSIVERLSWLKANGCTFSFDVDAEIAAARAIVPEWSEQEAVHAADSQEGRGGAVHTDTSFAGFDALPLRDLIASALNARDRRHGHLQEYDPYAGLCTKRPIRVLAALMLANEPSEILRLGWTYFLQSGARREDKASLATLIMRRLTTVSDPVLVDVLYPVSSWLEVAAKRVFETDKTAVRGFIDRLTNLTARYPDQALGAQRRTDGERDWLRNAWSSVAGHLTAVLITDPGLSGIAHNALLPDGWKRRADALRALPKDHGRFALAQLAQHIDWFYARDRPWTDAAILSVLDQPGDDRDAALAGFFHRANIGDKTLMDRLKLTLIGLATGDDRLRERYEQVLAKLCIGAWQQMADGGNRWLSDEELRTVVVYCCVNMRTHMLWHVDRWPIEEKLAVLKGVWPLQLAAKGSAVTGRLCTIAFDDEKNFPALVDAILPLVSPLEGGSLMLPLTRDDKSKIFERFPDQVLVLLSKVLPTSVAQWPYGAAQAIERLANAKPVLVKDSRFVALKRRMSARF
jgi:SIR2-like domain